MEGSTLEQATHRLSTLAAAFLDSGFRLSLIQLFAQRFLAAAERGESLNVALGEMDNLTTLIALRSDHRDLDHMPLLDIKILTYVASIKADATIGNQLPN